MTSGIHRHYGPNKLLVSILAMLCTLAFSADCGTTEAAARTARIGTWNLEWFGALGRKDRDIKKIAEIIQELRIDILALEEITCPCTMEKLVGYLDDYDYFISTQKVPQKLALLWNTKRVGKMTFDSAAHKALRGVAVTGLERESRQPLVFRGTIDKFDFTLIVVHLKAIPEAEWSVKVRNIQYDVINGWLQNELSSPGADQDIIIAGDFNSLRTGISSERLLSAGHVMFATAGLPEDEYSDIWYDRDGNRNLSFIDHIAITPALKSGEFNKVEPVRDWDVEMGKSKYENRISDHLPVVAVFKTGKDID